MLKIDRSFVSKINEPKSYKLAQSIVSIGHHMNLNIVAEGVEDLDQVNILADMGCGIFQGYYFAKPMKAQEFIDWHNDPGRPLE